MIECSTSTFTYALECMCVCTHMHHVNIHFQIGNYSLLLNLGCLKNAHYKAFLSNTLTEKLSCSMDGYSGEQRKGGKGTNNHIEYIYSIASQLTLLYKQLSKRYIWVCLTYSEVQTTHIRLCTCRVRVRVVVMDGKHLARSQSIIPISTSPHTQGITPSLTYSRG